MSNWEGIIGTRNILAHAYDQIDMERIEAAVAKSIPQLLREVRALIKS